MEFQVNLVKIIALSSVVTLAIMPVVGMPLAFIGCSILLKKLRDITAKAKNWLKMTGQ